MEGPGRSLRRRQDPQVGGLQICLCCACFNPLPRIHGREFPVWAFFCVERIPRETLEAEVKDGAGLWNSSSKATSVITAGKQILLFASPAVE